MATNTGDPYVLNVQRWLNNNYGDDSRFKKVSEDGYVGWGTINGLIRALQIRLGIQQTADNFGTGTINAFKSKFPNGVIQQDDGDETEDKIYGIIQGALLCKGYSTGVNTPTLHFYNGTGNAIKKLKRDAGIDDSNSVVTLNIMRALLSMDYFVTYNTSEKAKKIQEIQRYLNRNYESYIGLKPCDGVYSRSTNTSLIYAIQAEEGLPIGTANGNFGPSTKKYCPTIPYNNIETNYKGSKYSNEKIKKFMKLVNMGLYLNGVGTGNFDSETDKELVKQFQKKYALSVTGIVNLGTWLSIFISCGDTSRSALACDCATILTDAKAKTLYNNGYRYVGRYLSGYVGNGIPKNLTRTEMDIIFANGLNVFPIFQESGNSVNYFTEVQAEKDVKSAYENALNLGFLKNSIIYFAVDCDPLDTQIKNIILKYFAKISSIMKDRYKNFYKIGIYGTRNCCQQVLDKGYAVSCFVSDMSTGFSGNLGFTIPEKWAFDQFATVTIGTGDGRIEIDKDAFSGKDLGSNVNIEFSILTVYNFLKDIYGVAINYANGDITKANLYTAQAVRYFNEGYRTDMFEKTCGKIDKNFWNEVLKTLNKSALDFVDPVKKVNCEITHFSATLNALIYDILFHIELADALTDEFVGWAGDIVTYAKNIYENNWDYEQAKKYICSHSSIIEDFVPNSFDLVDYIGDVDAINIFQILQKDKNKTLPIAFLEYYTNVGDITCNKRTTNFINYYKGYENFTNHAYTVIVSDTIPYPTLRNIIEETTEDSRRIAESAFVFFVESELAKEK